MTRELTFFQMQIDYYMDTSSTEDQRPVILIHGIDMEKKPVRLHVRGFLPYMYVKSPEEDIKEALAKYIDKAVSKGRLVRIHEKSKFDLYGFSQERAKFYKLLLSSPMAIPTVRQLLSNVTLNGKRYKLKAYESNIGYVMRFMVDKKMVGMSYLHAKRCRVADGDYFCTFEDVEQLEIEGEFAKMPPFKILSIDIECISMSTGFPQAKCDPVIQIGNTLSRYGVMQRDIFCLKETSSIPGASVVSFEDERSLLVAWRNYLLKADPDVIVGFNIKNFDIPFLLERARVHSISDFAVLGRSQKSVKVRDVTFSSKQMGSSAFKEVDMEGRLIFDLYQIIRREYKLRSYTLNSISVHFLGEQKEDVPYYEIKKLQNGDRDTRKRIASYCLKDTYLPLRLFHKLNIVMNHAELSRVMGVPISYITVRGHSIKSLSLILRKAKEMEYLCPTIDAVDTEKTFEGGYVMEAQKGFYPNPIAVLDFSSLYPSIMIANNICYTTLLSPRQVGKVPSEHYVETPTGNHFIKATVKEGILPQVSRYLLENRKKTKRQMAETNDEELRSCLNARQEALKIAANSIYGFTGSMLGKLPCIEVSQSITALGRNMIIETKRMIEERYRKSDTFRYDAKVIYGDTDSVMIDLGEENLERVYEISRGISEYVTSRFVKPVSLEFEKVYHPFLLINKKRYAGLIHRTGKVDTKGIETVRRDNCELVKHIIENSLNYILWEKNVEKAKQFVKDTIRDLYLDRIDMSRLVISKAITKHEAKYQAKQAHIELAEKMRKRDPNSAPGLGDRVAYVIVKGGKNVPAYERSEDPLYVLENGLTIDKEHYIEHQLSNPIQRLFEPVMDNVEELLRGSHTRVHVTAQSRGPMSMFLTKNVVCLGCKSVGSILCGQCRGDFLTHFMRLESSVEKKKITFSKCWVECQRCQSSLCNEVLCVNRDCPIFYMRTKVMKDLEGDIEKLEQLRNLEW